MDYDWFNWSHIINWKNPPTGKKNLRKEKGRRTRRKESELIYCRDKERGGGRGAERRGEKGGQLRESIRKARYVPKRRIYMYTQRRWMEMEAKEQGTGEQDVSEACA